MTKEEQIHIITNLIQLAKDYAADEGAIADNDPEILKGYELIAELKKEDEAFRDEIGHHYNPLKCPQ